MEIRWSRARRSVKIWRIDSCKASSLFVCPSQVTGFTNKEEFAVVKEDLVPFLLEDKLKVKEICRERALRNFSPEPLL